jgi:hypothetical protein
MRWLLFPVTLFLVISLISGCTSKQAPASNSTPTPAPTQEARPVVIVTPTSGPVAEVYANSLNYSWRQIVGAGYTTNNEDGLPLVGGVTVSFNKMKRVELTYQSPNKLTLTINLLDGRTMTGEIAKWGQLNGSTELGSFSLDIDEVKSIDFQQ